MPIDKHLGYEYRYDPKHPLADKSGKVYMHRIVASEKLGRNILHEEHVHHIDGNKLNNDPDNLQILSASEHAKILHQNNPSEKFYCKDCGKKLNTKRKTGMCRVCYKNYCESNKKEKKRSRQISKREYSYRESKTCLSCGKLICDDGLNNLCMPCYQKTQRRFEVTKEELEKLVWEMPTTEVGKLFGVSDKAIEKRCQILGISKPPRGYWNKFYAEKL